MSSIHPVIHSTCHQFTMSSFHHVIHSSCHRFTMSSICHVIHSPCHLYTMSFIHYNIHTSCHPFTMSFISHVIHAPCHKYTMSSIRYNIHTPQWFCLVPLTRFGPILRKKCSSGRNFFLVRATAETKIVLKHKLPNADYRRCTRWLIQLELHKKSIFQNLIWKNLKKIRF